MDFSFIIHNVAYNVQTFTASKLTYSNLVLFIQKPTNQWKITQRIKFNFLEKKSNEYHPNFLEIQSLWRRLTFLPLPFPIVQLFTVLYSMKKQHINSSGTQNSYGNLSGCLKTSEKGHTPLQTRETEPQYQKAASLQYKEITFAI